MKIIKLTQIIGTLDIIGFQSCFTQSRQQHSRKNGDNCNNYKKFY